MRSTVQTKNKNLEKFIELLQLAELDGNAHGVISGGISMEKHAIEDFFKNQWKLILALGGGLILAGGIGIYMKSKKTFPQHAEGNAPRGINEAHKADDHLPISESGFSKPSKLQANFNSIDDHEPDMEEEGATEANGLSKLWDGVGPQNVLADKLVDPESYCKINDNASPKATAQKPALRNISNTANHSFDAEQLVQHTKPERGSSRIQSAKPIEEEGVFFNSASYTSSTSIQLQQGKDDDMYNYDPDEWKPAGLLPGYYYEPKNPSPLQANNHLLKNPSFTFEKITDQVTGKKAMVPISLPSDPNNYIVFELKDGIIKYHSNGTSPASEFMCLDVNQLNRWLNGEIHINQLKPSEVNRKTPL